MKYVHVIKCISLIFALRTIRAGELFPDLPNHRHLRKARCVEAPQKSKETPAPNSLPPSLVPTVNHLTAPSPSPVQELAPAPCGTTEEAPSLTVHGVKVLHVDGPSTGTGGRGDDVRVGAALASEQGHVVIVFRRADPGVGG